MNKTLKREVVIERVNNAMTAPFLTPKEKLAIATFVEAILIAGNSYNGYTVDSDLQIAGDLELFEDEFKSLPIEERKEFEVKTRRYF